MKLYEKETIHSLQWPDSEEGRRAKEYLLPLVQEGPNAFINNVRTELRVLQIDQVILPITINDAEYENSYICSPYTQYIECAKEAIQKLSKGLYFVLKPVLSALGLLVKKAKINRVVMVNNWLLTTCLYPQLSKEQIRDIGSFLVERFPRHAILFRCLDHQLGAAFKSMGCALLPSRPIYMLDAVKREPFKCRSFIKDRKFFDKSDYDVVSAAGGLEEAHRIAELYSALYIEKHTQKSPQYSHKFFQHLIQSDMLRVQFLKKDGSIDAVFGYYDNQHTMTSPLFGYDTKKPKQIGLYRLLNMLQTLEAKKRGLKLNMSSGAGKFKRQRKAKPQIEYTGVWASHLPLQKRWFWSVLGNVLRYSEKLMIKIDR